MTALYQNLQKVGLTPNQSTVYLKLSREGEAKAGELIKSTGLHRNLVYTALSELVDKKLISVSQIKGVAVYRALPPIQLLSAIHEKEAVAKDAIRELSSLSKGSAQGIVVYEGIDEIRQHERRTYGNAKVGSTLRFLGVSPQWYDIMGPGVVEELADLQKQKKLHLKHIVPDVMAKDRTYAKTTKGLTEFKQNPLITSDTSCTAIMDDRIAIRSYIGSYFVVEIINSEIAKNYQRYFDFLWRQKGSK